MVATLAQLHLDVHELRHAIALQRLHEEAVVALEDSSTNGSGKGQMSVYCSNRFIK